MDNIQSKHNDHRIQQAEAILINKITYSTFDFLGSLLFVIGSLLFFSEATAIPGVWAFLFGSAFLGVRPTANLIRELSQLRRYRARRRK